MVIGYVLKMYPRFSETFVLNEILELERRGVEIRIFSLVKPDDGRFHAGLARVQAKVMYLPEYPRHQFAQVWPSVRALMGRDPRRFARNLLYALVHPNGMGLKQFLRACVLAEALKARPVDHLHAHFASGATSVAMQAHLFTGIPFSFTAHAKDIYLHAIDRQLLRDKLRLAKFVVAVSDFNRNFLLDELKRSEGGWSTRLLGKNGTAPSRAASIRRLYNGIDLKQFDTSIGREDASGSKPLILSVGRLVEKKGFEDMVRACAILRDEGLDFHCEIVGKGPREAALRELVTALDLNDVVELVGPRPMEEMVSCYARATVFALPCIVGADGNRDGTPTVIIEAMALGVPVVSTRVTGIPEIVDDGSTGLLVPEHDPSSLAEALKRLLNDAELRDSMGRLAREKIRRDFDLRQNAQVLMGWFSGSLPDTQKAPTTKLAAKPIREDPISVR